MQPTAIASNPQPHIPHRIVIVGGGAGGLELATKLGNSLGRSGRAEVTLVDRDQTHLWKPLLHEVAAGSMDIHQHQLDYLAQARWHRFTFALGALSGLDRERREAIVAPVRDDEGAEVLPERRLAYDTLVIAIGSQSNDFGTPGVREHAFTIDQARDANVFHRRLVNACFRANFAADGSVLHIAIVGAGATGVELAAELHNTTRTLAAYGLKNFDPTKQIRITLIEAGPRILPGLPEYVAEETLKVLQSLGIEVLVNEKVVGITEEAVKTATGREVPGRFTVWTAGIRCADVLATLGLETDRINRLVVKPSLETTRDANIFAIGDCAAAPWTEGKTVPPRAQAAHQQSSHLVKTIKRRLAGKASQPYHYRDFGSLISLGHYDTIGQLMGFAGGGRMRVEGYLAKLFYVALYRQHIWALHGFWRMALDTLARLIKRQTEPKVKLH
ncbi:NADH dehydrogenase [Usitatibacter rugosus]|uniref:NADH dehydrogenase n=1 Tax=Usitatibacter rugosus TaxID=2732067 RepID=A0A6M4GSK0_9PROT|nr:NAD(P)/FAD-dependent oxidoreductase [Usitatibacter rugosus]QJR10221.1 NADH dehydrogenase [Usitatibacter rugosus]